MQIHLRCDGSAVVVRLKGRLTVGTDFSPLHRLCGQLNRSPGNTIVVDLSQVDRMDCTGIGELVQLHTCAGLAGGEMRIVNVGRFHRELLEMFRLIEPLNVCSTWRAALRGCESEVGEIRFAWHLPNKPASSGLAMSERGGER